MPIYRPPFLANSKRGFQSAFLYDYRTWYKEKTTEIFNARYSDYSYRANHFVEFDFISPWWSKRIREPLDKVYWNEVMFTRKSNALRFIKLLNSQ